MARDAFLLGSLDMANATIRRQFYDSGVLPSGTAVRAAQGDWGGAIHLAKEKAVSFLARYLFVDEMR
jgi:hypothetical protein